MRKLMVLLALEVSSWQPSQVLQIEYVFLRSMREATAYGGLEAAVGVQDDSRIESLQLCVKGSRISLEHRGPGKTTRRLLSPK